jgi:hypothetical protein
MCGNGKKLAACKIWSNKTLVVTSRLALAHLVLAQICGTRFTYPEGVHDVLGQLKSSVLASVY